jgi:virginiamycin B lyase
LTTIPTREIKGTISEIPLPSPKAPPYGITTGPDGNLWFGGADADGFNGTIGRITPSGKISEFPLPTPRGDPSAITGGPDGAIWFIEANSNKIGRLI